MTFAQEPWRLSGRRRRHPHGNGYSLKLWPWKPQTRRGCSAIPSRGPLAANTVAGAISGWQAALDLGGGKLPLTRLLQDAIWYASHGAPVTANQVAYTTRFLGELSPQPGFAKTFLDGSELPRAQTLRRYPRLASTLEHLATRGLDDFYRGELASAIADEFARLDAPVRSPDLAAHRASIVKPLSVQLRVGTAYNLPPPTQGLASLMILGIFERLSCNRPEGFEHVHGVVVGQPQVDPAACCAARYTSRFVRPPAHSASTGKMASQYSERPAELSNSSLSSAGGLPTSCLRLCQ